MEYACDSISEFELLICKAEQLREVERMPEAIAECSATVEWAARNNAYREEMRGRNLLASLCRKAEDWTGMLAQYGKVVGIGREQGLRFTDEYVHALYHAVVFLTRIQPPLPQMFTLTDELVEVRSKMVRGDENDKELQDYKMIQGALRRTYRRRHRLRGR